MKANTTDHPKFMRLKRRLKLTKWEATGLLETLWNMTAKNAPRGNIGKFDNEEIAAFLEWDGDEHELIDVLIKSGWIDECEDNRLVVHDWPDHCPFYVKGNVSKMGGFAEPVASTQPQLFGDPPKTEKKAAKSKTTADTAIVWSASSQWTGITDGDISRWAEAYPACNVKRQLASMDAWLSANPAKARKKNWKSFITRWLSKEQDRGGDMKGQSNRPGSRKPEPSANPEDTKVTTW